MPKVIVNDIEKELGTAITYTAPYQEKKTTYFSVLTEERIKSVKIIFDQKIELVTIRPLSLKIDYKIIDDFSIEVDLNKKVNISIEPNGDLSEAILIFAGQKDAINKAEYENIIYFEKGRHLKETLKIEKDNTLLYLEEGAILDGRIRVEGAKNIALDGYGCITHECFSYRTNGIYFLSCKNIKVQNICIKDFWNWNLKFSQCENIVVDNVKIIGSRGNSDGIDVVNSKNVLVKNCFTRVWDDSLVVKGLTDGNVENVVFENCVLWNDFARPIEIGVETRADEIKNVTFKDMDIIHSATRYPILGIHTGDRAKISDILFENIVIEDAPGAQLVDLRIIKSGWNKEDTIGNIRRVTFKDINVLRQTEDTMLPYHSRLQGYSKESNIEDIVFENISRGDRTAETIEELGLKVFDYVSNVKVLKTNQGPKINRIRTEIFAEYQKPEKGMYPVEVSVVLENMSEFDASGYAFLSVNPSWVTGKIDEIVYSLKPKEKMVARKKLMLPAGKYALSLCSGDTKLEASNEFLNLPLVLKKNFSAPYKFSDSYGNFHNEEVRFAYRDKCIVIKSELLKKYDLILYVAKKTKRENGEMLFSIEDSNSGLAPALNLVDGKVTEAPQIGCPEEIAFVFKNYPKTEIKSIKIHKKIEDTAYIPMHTTEIEDKEFLMELVLCADFHKRYEFSLFGSPIPKETIREPRVMAHMFAETIVK